jgi:hypothetical protein
MARFACVRNACTAASADCPGAGRVRKIATTLGAGVGTVLRLTAPAGAKAAS